MERFQVKDNKDPEQRGRVLTEVGWLEPIVYQFGTTEIPELNAFVYGFDGFYIKEGYTWKKKD